MLDHWAGLIASHSSLKQGVGVERKSQKDGRVRPWPVIAGPEDGGGAMRQGTWGLLKAGKGRKQILPLSLRKGRSPTDTDLSPETHSGLPISRTLRESVCIV